MAGRIVCVLTMIVLPCGCSSAPDTIEVPKVSPSTTASALVAAADTDGDDALSAAELEKLPSVKWAAKDIDRNADGKLSSDEITQHVEDRWQTADLKLMPFVLQLELDGKPLAGAEVEFVPSSGLAGQSTTARGTTDKYGLVAPTITPESLTAGQIAPAGQMQPGFYDVKVSHPSLPARYRKTNSLGIEVAPSSSMQRPMLKLQSR